MANPKRSASTGKPIYRTVGGVNKPVMKCCCGCPCAITEGMCVLIWVDADHWAKVDQMGDSLCQFNEFFDPHNLGYEDVGLFWDEVNCQWAIEHLFGGTLVDGGSPIISWEGRYTGPTTPTSPFGTYTLQTTVIGSPPTTVKVLECSACDDCPTAEAYASLCPTAKTFTIHFEDGDETVSTTAGSGEEILEGEFSHGGDDYSFFIRCGGGHATDIGCEDVWQAYILGPHGLAVFVICKDGCCIPTGHWTFDRTISGGVEGLDTSAGIDGV